MQNSQVPIEVNQANKKWAIKKDLQENNTMEKRRKKKSEAKPTKLGPDEAQQASSL